MDLQPPDEETMVSVAIADLEQQFTTVDHAQIETTVRRSVHALFDRARVKAFVGVIAERQAREQLRELQSQGMGRTQQTRDAGVAPGGAPV